MATTQNVTITRQTVEIPSKDVSPEQRVKFTTSDPKTSHDYDEADHREEAVEEEEEEEEIIDVDPTNTAYLPAQLQYAPLQPTTAYAYPYGYPIHPTVSPNHMTSPTGAPNTEAIFSLNVYNITKETTAQQFTDFIVSALGDEYFRAFIYQLSFYKQNQEVQTDELKFAVVKIYGFEVTSKMNKFLNGQEFDGNVLSSSISRSAQTSYYHQVSATSPPALSQHLHPHHPENPYRHRSFSSSSTILSSPSGNVFPVPVLAASFDEEAIEDESPNRSPSPAEYGATIPEAIPMIPAQIIPPPPPSQYYAMQEPYYLPFQYAHPYNNAAPPTNYYNSSTHNRNYRYTSSPMIQGSAQPLRYRSMSIAGPQPQYQPIPFLGPAPHSHTNTASSTSPRQSQPPFLPLVSALPHPQVGSTENYGNYYSHNRTRSLPSNQYMNPWLLANRYQQQQQQHKQPDQQQRYGHSQYHYKSRSVNKYAPILDVSDDDDEGDEIDDEFIESLIAEDKDHTMFNESEHVDKCRLFVGNIPFSAQWPDLRDFISERVSGLIRVEIPQQLNGVSKGFAIALFNDPDRAAECIQIFDGIWFQGRQLTVRYDRHMKFIRKYNNVQAMMKNGGLKLPELIQQHKKLGKTSSKDTEEPSEPQPSASPKMHAEKLTLTQNQEAEDEVARELMNSLKIK